MDQQPQDIRKEDTGSKEGTLAAIMAANPQFTRYSSHPGNHSRQNYFVFSDGGSRIICHVNCNTLIMSRNSKANGSAASASIESYVFDPKNDVYNISRTEIDTSHLGWSARQREFFRKMRDVAEGKDFSHCSYLAQTPQGELEVKANGCSCILPSSYEGRSISELFALREKLFSAKNYLRKKAEDIKTTQEQKKEIHLALLVLEGNLGELNKIYIDPRKSGGWVNPF